MKRLAIWGSVAIFMLVAAASCGTAYDPENPPPNFIVILTDDMDMALMPYMEQTNKLIAEEGAVFTNYFVTSSTCCPSRASILRGQYPHNTGVHENSPGFEQFHENGHNKDTLATWLKGAGYRTSYMGKFMNLYPAGVKRTYVPPGWTDWHVFVTSGRKSADFYMNYILNENGKLADYDDEPEGYSTDVLKNKAVDFITKSVDARSPFFLYVSPYAPHSPFVVAPRHAEAYTDLTYPQGPSFHEEDTSDKPEIIRDIRRTGGKFEVSEADAMFVKRVQTMLAVDEMVAELVQLLEANGQLQNTYFIFTSDNGFHMGEHDLPSGKMLPYEEDIRVPFVIRGPGIAPNTIITDMTANIDIAPTLAEWAGVKPASYVDGRSFARLFQPGGVTDWRNALLIESGDYERDSPVVAHRGVRAENFIFVEYESGELEFYDLVNDPYQLENIASSLPSETLAILQQWLAELKACQTDACRQVENNVSDGILY
jgi:N-acetylglucosamine-6-sulfatase